MRVDISIYSQESIPPDALLNYLMRNIEVLKESPLFLSKWKIGGSYHERNQR